MEKEEPDIIVFIETAYSNKKQITELHENYENKLSNLHDNKIEAKGHGIQITTKKQYQIN